MENKKEKPIFTPRKAAQYFIRPYVLKGNTIPLHPSFNLRHETENYSACIEGSKVVVTKLYGVKIREEFPIKEIMKDVTIEHSYRTGIAGIHASTAEEGYEKRRQEILDFIERLYGELISHKRKFEKDCENWGYVGDLERAAKLLKKAAAFLQ